MASRLFAVERYDDSGTTTMAEAPFPALPTATHFVGAVYLPFDEVVIAFVEGADEASVADTVRAAGWRVDRIGPANWLAETSTPPESSPSAPSSPPRSNP